jgi:hypothetical protein
LLAVIWNTNRSDDDDGTIELHLLGSAENYLNWRTVVLRNLETLACEARSPNSDSIK